MKHLNKILILIFVLSLILWLFSGYRNTSCGYDCGIIPDVKGGSGMVVIVASILSLFFLGLSFFGIVFLQISKSLKNKKNKI